MREKEASKKIVYKKPFKKILKKSEKELYRQKRKYRKKRITFQVRIEEKTYKKLRLQAISKNTTISKIATFCSEKGMASLG